MHTDQPEVLVVGGAGYIGSHMVRVLQHAGYRPVVLDNLSKGHRDAVSDVEFIVGDLSDTQTLSALFSKYAFKAVMHFAAYIDVAESMREPLKYYQNNVAATLSLLQAMMSFGVKRLVFSSTAAVYGYPQTESMNESHPLQPINPYGQSKKIIEQVIQDLAHAHGLRYAILRYFNAAGADSGLCEQHEPETHLIPNVLQVAAGLKPKVTIYGNDYPTPDGTCVRDYVHVHDICQAHLLTLQAMMTEQRDYILNVGNARGYSVLEVIAAAERVTGCKIPYQITPRRAGDPPVLVADASLARSLLHWQPRYPDLETQVSHAWRAVGLCQVL